MDECWQEVLVGNIQQAAAVERQWTDKQCLSVDSQKWPANREDKQRVR